MKKSYQDYKKNHKNNKMKILLRLLNIGENSITIFVQILIKYMLFMSILKLHF